MGERESKLPRVEAHGMGGSVAWDFNVGMDDPGEILRQIGIASVARSIQGRRTPVSAWTAFLRSFDRGGGFDAEGSSVSHIIRRPSVEGWQAALCGARALRVGRGREPVCDACWAEARREFKEVGGGD